MVSSSCAVQALRIIQLHREQYSIAIRGDLIVIGLLAIATTADGARLAPECRMGRGPARRLREDGSSASARHKTERICLEPEAIRIRQPVNTFVGDGGELADNMMSLFSSARIVPAALVGLPESTCTSESAVAMHSLLDTAREGRCRGVEGFGHREGAVEAALARVEGRMQSVVPEEEQREGRQLREALKPRNDILRTFFEAPAAASAEMVAIVLSSTARLWSKALCSVGSSAPAVRSTHRSQFPDRRLGRRVHRRGASLCCESRQ